jgi:hypothetical protein
VGCDPFTFLSHTVHNPGLPSAFDHLKKWFRGVSGKKKGLVRIHGCVHYQSRCQKDSIWHLLGSKPLLSHITRTRPRLVNIALSGPMSFFSPFHTTPQMLRRRNLETSRKCYLETPPKAFSSSFCSDVFSAKECQKLLGSRVCFLWMSSFRTLLAPIGTQAST